MKKLFAPLLLALAVLLIGGCANNTEVITNGLRAELVRLQPGSGGDVKVTWRLRNPNVVPYVIARSALKITIDGKLVGEAPDSNRFGVPSLNQAEQTTVLPASAITDRAALDAALARGSADYSLNATIWILLLDDKLEKFHVTASGTVATGAP